MKKIDTLVEDIERVLVEGVEEVPEELIAKYQEIFGQMLRSRFLTREPKATLRMSNAGKPCSRQTYYEINNHEDAEPLTASTYNKFALGDLTEIHLLFLCELAGHKVEGTQDVQDIEGIKGHRDCVIDGVVIDAKSASSFSFKKFKEGRLAEDDAFGYIDQIGSYLYAAQDDPIVTVKDRAGFLVMDKTLGHICLDIHMKTDKDYSEFMKGKKEQMDAPEPPERAFDPEPEGKSGNMKLGTNCSYCSFKKKCFPTLRSFAYSYGPVHLVTVAREPKVPEIT